MVILGRPKKYSNRTTITTTTELELYKQFQEICRREGVSIADKLNGFMEDYIKVHGSGNPQFNLEPFIENPKFRADPAFRADKQQWVKYIHSSKLSEVEEMERQHRFIGAVLKTARHNKLRELEKKN